MTAHDPLQRWHADRSRLFGLAYAILGSAADAEDVLQDVAEQLHAVPRHNVRDAEAWLKTVVVRRALDSVRSARRRREEYVGMWLPEPLVREPIDEAGPEARVMLDEQISYALLVVLHELTAPERVAFLLHDVFGEPYSTVAMAVDRSVDATRQLASRARRRVRQRGDRPEKGADPGEEQLVLAFLRAAGSGQVDGLVELLSDDATAIADGGGLVRAARRPITGASRVARYLAGVVGKRAADGWGQPVLVNDGPGARLWSGGKLEAVMALDARDGRVHGVYLVANPNKLAGPRPCTQ